MRLNIVSTVFLTMYANDNTSFIPQVWAQESLMILEANLVAANLVHRDFSNEIAQFGDVVNTRKPGSFTATRKGVNDDVTDQDASSTNVAVPLDQHLHTTFIIKDGEESKSFKSLVEEYLHPAALSLAQAADQIVAGQVYQFMGNAVGKIGTTMDATTVIAAKEKLNALKCPMQGRNMIITPGQEGALLNIAGFTQAQAVGDDGSALKEGSLGRKYGFDMFMDQNAPSIVAAATATGAINLAAGYGVGTTALTVDGFSAAITSGGWVTVDGQPYKVASTTGGATPTVITIDAPGLRVSVADNAVVMSFAPSQVNLAAGYAAGWYKGMVYDTVTPIKVGQLISSASDLYAAIDGTTATSLVTDRPLKVAVADDAVLGRGPAGDYGFAFHKNALALITRPLATPRAGTGALSSVASYNGLGLRVTITYDGKAQGHRVTLDMLAGVKVLDVNLGCPILA